MIRADIPRKKYIRDLLITPSRKRTKSDRIELEFFEVNFFCYYKKGHRMKGLSFIKKQAMAMAAIAIATASLTIMSFKKVDENQQNLEWYARISNNNYQLIPGAPSTEPGNGCLPAGSELCAKGFAPGEAPDVIDDMTLAVDRFHP